MTDPVRSEGRVLVVTNDFPPRLGGIERVVHQLCEGLPADRVVVHTSSTPGDRAFDRDLAYPVVRDPARMLLPTPAVRRRVVETFERHGCDRVVFGASAPLGLLGPALRDAGAKHIQALTHGHEVWWAALPGTRQLLGRIGDSTDDLTYVSEYCRDRIAPALSPAARARFRRYVIEVDRERFRPDCGGAEVRAALGIPATAPVVVCAGRLVRRKGQDTLIAVWREVLEVVPDAWLLIVGDGPDRRRLRAMARVLGVDQRVVFTGSVSFDQMPAHLDAGDVFAMPARSRWFGLQVEAFGIVNLEAVASGLLLAGARSGGTPEAAAQVRVDHARP
ncbi:glycosyltransferase family 4 protein [Nocardioides sp. HDW12B]|uniref:glycosyltransferase family 4 protein n=1 Tax=Nocardioides sp. HDW12B TaxID=2714939 RepID=UPI001408DE1F|nr:glycosyltransferase family 4 protein [Nocardioides sp. HDW12B]QIK66071.1 glycosyltransferase family 4 protein [Nocardioides sp. HDW12B]